MNIKEWKGIPGKGIKYAENFITNCDKNCLHYEVEVFREYLNHFGEQKGIEEFYKNYKSLKILDEWRDLKIPNPHKFSEVDEYKEEDY